jgi:hypothetical protein
MHSNGESRLTIEKVNSWIIWRTGVSISAHGENHGK